MERPPVARPAEKKRPTPGVTQLDEDQARFQRRTILVITVLPFLAFLFAVWSLWGNGLSALDAGIFLGMYLFTGLGVTIGFHRCLTHGSFESQPGLRALLAIAGSMSIEGSVIAWVSAHRRHHAFADKEGDPHSPHLDEGPGLRGVLKGLHHAHMGWLFDPEKTSHERWAPDLLKEPAMVKIDKAFPLLLVVSLGLPAVLGFAFTQTWQGTLSAFLWGGLVRIFLLHHVTWSVNSICHFYGKTPFKTTDFSTNNWLLSLVSFGESWHNNHHAFPTSARHGIQRGQIDISARVIAGFEKLGLVRNVKYPTPKQLESKQG
ncbi:MAG: acyl-CoA desaturase [Actinobacteria bacterium]|nr:acyl-CoA desaturase [Actinomycetota bacterium]